MRKRHWRKIAQYSKRSQLRSIWRKIVRAMACIVVFCTTYALILPAITMEKTYFCEMEAHTHTQECYTVETASQLHCPIPEVTAHRHDASCYEILLGHTHEEGCYDDNGEVACGLEESADQQNLVCEIQDHFHSVTCLDAEGNLVCGLEEVQEHSHDESCYTVTETQVLTCTVPEHEHSDACTADPNADVETPEIWEGTLEYVERSGTWTQDVVSIARTQLGYTESQQNVLYEEGKETKGYTRYGAWYGIPYGSWDAMFASFCLHYADIPQEAVPHGSDSEKWLESLRKAELTGGILDGVPGEGDILFYSETEEAPIRSAIIMTLEHEADSGEINLQLIEGDKDNAVAQHRVVLNEITLHGCLNLTYAQQRYNLAQMEADQETTAEETTAATEPTQTAEITEPTVPEETTATTLPEETTEPAQQDQTVVQTAQTDNYIVTVTYSQDLVLPEGAALRVVEYAKDSDIFRQRCEEAGYELEWLLNIGFFLGEEELTLDGAFDVLVTSKQGLDLGSDITHFADDGAERILGQDASEEVQDGQTAVAFSAEGFSDFGGGIALAAETGGSGISTFAIGSVMEADVFSFATANPSSLQENTDYAIYLASNDTYYFMGSQLENMTVSRTGLYYSPTNAGQRWTLSAGQMGTTFASDFTWRVVRENNQVYLESQKDGTRLQLNRNSAGRTENGSALTITPDGSAATIRSGGNYLRHRNYVWTGDTGYASRIYFAAVAPAYRNYPAAVSTGEAHVDRLRFYNICESNDGISALPGCVFLIEGTTDAGASYSYTIESGSDPQIGLPDNIPDGEYTITEVSVPDGYMRDTNYQREFWIKNGKLESEHNIGIFLNHSVERLSTEKTGEVEDYNNRIYQILMSAKTNLRMYQMDPIDVLFVVDKSNSMLFPSGMKATGKSITLGLNNQNNVSNNAGVLNSLDKSVMHYIIADPQGTSTVYAIWHDGTAWLYQDASYYAKAMQGNGDGYKSDGETVIFPGDRTYSAQSTWEDDTFGDSYRSNGGGLNRDMTGCTLGNYISDNGGSVTFQLYTAKDEYNRLHYLEEALANMIYELADANHENRVTLIPFTKEVQSTIIYPRENGSAISQPVTLTTSNAEMLVDVVTHIDTTGGTRQDLALEHAMSTYLSRPDRKDKDHTYTILVTDGAPVRSGSSAPALGDPNSAATTDANGTIYGRIKGWAGSVRERSTLMTVALGMEFVEGGKKVLEDIASEEEFYCALDDASALTESMQRILFDGMKDKGELSINGSIEDEISDSFYPIAWTDSASNLQRTILVENTDKTWILLQTGDWITLDGKFTTSGASDAAGQLLCREDGTYYIQWVNQPVSGSGWNGTFYVKAKEDFIGGNAIDTNKAASVTVNDLTVELETPTVNVRLLDMNENSSEVTLYLGDVVNAQDSTPRDVLKAFFQDIQFQKLISNGGDVLNKYNSTDADGLEDAAFYLKYAFGYENEEGQWVARELTVDEWATLESGGTIRIEYTYDNPSSHGAVGYFNVTLTKSGPSASYDSHFATQACQPGGTPSSESCTAPAETYILNVTYTAYGLGEGGRPAGNVNNGSGSPGTEVGTGSTLETGLGQVISENTHEVHVISGKILVEKTMAEGVVWEAGKTFRFIVHRAEDGTSTAGDKEILVTLGADGTGSGFVENLPRGTYTVTEAVDEDYAVQSVAIGPDTNCESTQALPVEATFLLGNDPEGNNVIGKSSEEDAFTSYILSPDGVYGEAQFTNTVRVYQGDVPVEKIWEDGAEFHETDTVYVVLYLNDMPVLDADNNACILRLDAESDWKGIFTVDLADKNDKVSNYNYSVREVTAVSDEQLQNWTPAILENDGTTLMYYDRALEYGGLIGVSRGGYMVLYGKDENGVLLVTNVKSYDLPETGGMGTHMYTFSGCFLLGAALVYGYSLRRRQGRGASG